MNHIKEDRAIIHHKGADKMNEKDIIKNLIKFKKDIRHKEKIADFQKNRQNKEGINTGISKKYNHQKISLIDLNELWFKNIQQRDNRIEKNKGINLFQEGNSIKNNPLNNKKDIEDQNLPKEQLKMHKKKFMPSKQKNSHIKEGIKISHSVKVKDLKSIDLGND